MFTFSFRLLITLLVAGGLLACGEPDFESAGDLEPSGSGLTLTDGLVARYSFDDGTARDSSGKGRHGTAVGSPLFPSEHGGKAVLINGTTQSITIPHHADLAPAKTLTACSWVKPEVLTYPGRVLEKAGGGGYWMYLMEARVVFGFTASAGTYGKMSDGYVRVHEWNHICATTNGTTARIYINGALDSSFAVAGSMAPLAEPLVLGWKYNGIPADRLKGYLDDVRIYNRALAASEVSALYKDGTVATPVELVVKCTVPGDIYVNGHAVGKTCPATLSLPVAGHSFIGIGNVAKGYQQQEIFSNGQSPVVVSFGNSGWLGRRTWKVLLFSVRNTNLSNGKKAKLTNAEIAAALASVNQTNSEWVIPYSRYLLQWQVTSFIEEITAGTVITDSDGIPSLDTEGILKDSGHASFQSQYDHIFVFYPAATATDGSPYGACCGAGTGSFRTHVPNTWGVNGWVEVGGNHQLWLHEWLHSAEAQYGNNMGWSWGRGGLHGDQAHGFPPTQEEWGLPWYRAFMSGLVPEDGKLVGLSPMGYLESTVLQTSLLPRNTISPAGKPGSLKATAGTRKVTLSWSAASGSPLGYSVKRGTKSGGPYTRIAANLTTTSFVDTTGRSGTKYYYVVVSTSRGGESANSPQVSATPK